MVLSENDLIELSVIATENSVHERAARRVAQSGRLSAFKTRHGAWLVRRHEFPAWLQNRRKPTKRRSGRPSNVWSW
jgi:hypothetical protein